MLGTCNDDDESEDVESNRENTAKCLKFVEGLWLIRKCDHSDRESSFLIVINNVILQRIINDNIDDDDVYEKKVQVTKKLNERV